MFGFEVEKLCYQLKNVDGDFICRYSSKLASMENFPEHIKGTLDISFTNIHSLKDIPKNMKVDGDFVCTGTGYDFTEEQIRDRCQVKGKVYC